MIDENKILDTYLPKKRKKINRWGVEYTLIWIVVAFAIAYFSFAPAERGVYHIMGNALPFYLSPELYGAIIYATLVPLLYLEWRGDYQYHALIVFCSFVWYLAFTWLGIFRNEIPVVPGFVYTGFLLVMTSIFHYRRGYMDA